MRMQCTRVHLVGTGDPVHNVLACMCRHASQQAARGPLLLQDILAQRYLIKTETDAVNSIMQFSNTTHLNTPLVRDMSWYTLSCRRYSKVRQRSRQASPCPTRTNLTPHQPPPVNSLEVQVKSRRLTRPSVTMPVGSQQVARPRASSLQCTSTTPDRAS